MSLRRLGAAFLAAAAVITAAAAWTGSSSGQAPVGHAQSLNAAAVAAAVNVRPITGMDARVALRPDAVRRWIAQRDARPPLPPGGNFNGIDWEGFGDQVPLATADAILQHNARCQWRRARAAGRWVTTADRVIAASTDWPALRELDESAPGQPEGSLLPCLAAHEQEVRKARSLGLTPST